MSSQLPNTALFLHMLEHPAYIQTDASFFYRTAKALEIITDTSLDETFAQCFAETRIAQFQLLKARAQQATPKYLSLDDVLMTDKKMASKTKEVIESFYVHDGNGADALETYAFFQEKKPGCVADRSAQQLRGIQTGRERMRNRYGW